MSLFSRRPAQRAVRPSAELLEGRQLLAKVISGTDIDGDRWVLRLLGPGDIAVTNQPDAKDNPVPLGTPALIDTISIGGTDPLQSRLVGTVTPSEAGDGKVFFQNIEQFGGRAVGVVGSVGIHVIDMPDFWLGRTSTEATQFGVPAAEIRIADGVNNLRFGGVDATYTPPGGTPLNTNNRNDKLVVSLGIPRTIGTSIIIDQSISTAQAAVGTGQPTQDGVQFSVRGRINLFQANSIKGNADIPSGRYVDDGGTLVISGNGLENNGPNEGDLANQVNGSIGYVRVGNDATNFSVESSTNISNLFIGGETNNVFALATQQLRTALFGRGMDKVNIKALSVLVLQANRGAIGSTVVMSRAAGQFLFGGDVINTQVLSGYQQRLDLEFARQADVTPTIPPAQNGGALANVLIAGDVINSVFAASVEPNDGVFGSSDDLILPHGRVFAKVQGTIDNKEATPDMPTTAFYAADAQVHRGAVVPPNVAVPPYSHEGASPSGPRIAKHLLPSDPNAPSRRVSLNSRFRS